MNVLNVEQEGLFFSFFLKKQTLTSQGVTVHNVDIWCFLFLAVVLEVQFLGKVPGRISSPAMGFGTEHEPPLATARGEFWGTFLHMRTKDRRAGL